MRLSAAIKKAQFLGLVIDNIFTFEIQIDEKFHPSVVALKRYIF
jgi:hypothetical protein